MAVCLQINNVNEVLLNYVHFNCEEQIFCFQMLGKFHFGCFLDFRCWKTMVVNSCSATYFCCETIMEIGEHYGNKVSLTL